MFFTYIPECISTWLDGLIDFNHTGEAQEVQVAQVDAEKAPHDAEANNGEDWRKWRYSMHQGFRWSCKWIIFPLGFLWVSYPIPSMGLEYLPTWMVDFHGKCRQIHHTWMGMGFLWFPKTHTINQLNKRLKFSTISANSFSWSSGASWFTCTFRAIPARSE